MNTTYAPGTPALITIRNRGEHLAIRDSLDCWLVGDIDDLRVVYDNADVVIAVRPIPVLDYRNPRSVATLRDALDRAGVELTMDVIFAALLAITPTPPEPIGFGAVVLGLDKARWLRDEGDPVAPWVPEPGHPVYSADERRAYLDIRAIAVLNHGVPA